jgi:hypothetical protein
MADVGLGTRSPIASLRRSWASLDREWKEHFETVDGKIHGTDSRHCIRRGIY